MIALTETVTVMLEMEKSIKPRHTPLRLGGVYYDLNRSYTRKVYVRRLSKMNKVYPEGASSALCYDA